MARAACNLLVTLYVISLCVCHAAHKPLPPGAHHVHKNATEARSTVDRALR